MGKRKIKQIIVMNNEKENIEIPFGVFDSELGGWEYTIPEGFEAAVENGKVIVRKSESEDEKIRKGLILFVEESYRGSTTAYARAERDRYIAWLEKQAQKPTEWSEEDDRMCKAVIDNIKAICKEGYFVGNIGSDKLINWLKDLIERVQPQPKREWSEKDDIWLNNLICHFETGLSIEHERVASWLKSIKDRVQPQNLTVTDEEIAQAKKDAYNDALDKIEYHSGEPSFDDGWSAAIGYIQKKSLRPQSQWKPSDEQMEALNTINVTGCITEVGQGKYLVELYKQLKKLREE